MRRTTKGLLTAALITGALAATTGTAGAIDLTPPDGDGQQILADPSALTTHYDNAPGHGPSISATCDGDGIVFGHHPWNNLDPADRNHYGFAVYVDGQDVPLVAYEPDTTLLPDFRRFKVGAAATGRIVYGDGTYTWAAALCHAENDVATTTAAPTTTTETPAALATEAAVVTAPALVALDTTTTTTEPELEPEVLVVADESPADVGVGGVVVTRAVTEPLPVTGVSTWALVALAALLVAVGWVVSVAGPAVTALRNDMHRADR